MRVAQGRQTPNVVWSRISSVLLSRFSFRILKPSSGCRSGRMAAVPWLLMALVMLSSPAVHADVQYVYDSAGRLVQVVAPDGSSAVYNYDPAGNILSIDRLASGQLFLGTFSPLSGVPGSQVTLGGSGFSTTSASNAVTFNGIAASVVSSTANQIVVTVPATAVTGAVAVTVGANSVTSAKSFVVQIPPSLSAFTPSVVNAGATVTVTGVNLEPVSGATQVTVGSAAAQRLSLSATQLALRAPSTSGHIIVTTPYGSVSSVTPLIVAPGATSAANIVSSGLLVTGSGAQALNINQQSKYGAFAFDGTQGQLLSVQVSALVTTPSNATLSYQVFSPARAVIASGSITAASQSIHVPQLPGTGTYLVLFGTGNATAQFNAALEANSVLSSGGGSLAGVVTTSGGQSKRMWIAATAGEHMGVGLTGLAMSSGGSITVALYQPNGTYIWGRSCNVADPLSSCGLQYLDLPVTGNYILMATPNGTATMSFNLNVSAPITGTLTPGIPFDANTMIPGQFTVVTFTATQGQAMALNLGSVVTTPAGVNMYLSVTGPTGAAVGSPITTKATTVNYTNLAAGTYRVFLVPYFGVTASAQLTLANGLTGTLQSDGTTSATLNSSVPGQNGYFAIPATAGQNIGIALRSLVMTPGTVGSITLSLYQPNGTYMWGRSCLVSDPMSSCGLQFTEVPATGDYLLTAVPNGSAKMSFNLTVSRALTGSLAPGTPLNLNLAVPGQFAYLTFTATAGQTMALNLGSVVTTPTGVNMYLSVTGPNGAAVGSPLTTTNTTINYTNLAAGTYKVFLVAYFGITASAQLTLSPGTTATLPVDGSTSSFSTGVPGQNAYFTFAGTAGQGLGIALKNLVMSSGSATFSVTRPDGVVMDTSGVCSPSNPGGATNVWRMSLPQTGNYRITVVPSGQARMSFDIVVSSPVTLTPSSGTPASVSLPVWGQWGLLTFTATAGQDAAMALSSITTTPANQQVSVVILDPNGNQVVNGGGTGSRGYNLTNLLAGTYKIAVIPWYGVSASSIAQVTWGARVTATVPANGTSTHITTSVPGQSAYLTFAATASQGIGIGLNNLAMSSGSATFSVTRPDGGSLTTSGTCSPSNPGGGCNVFWGSLPQTGNYQITVVPNAQVTTSFDLAVSSPLSGALTLGTPQNISLPVWGQFGLLTFTATAGHAVAITLDSIVTSPVSQQVSLVIYDPNWNQVTNSAGTGSRVYNLTNPVTGVYKIAVVPWFGVTATARVTVN